MCEMNIWNEKDLPLPPINTYKAVKTNIDIDHLQHVFNEGKTFFEDQKFMYAEHTVLSTVVYRMKQKFRSAKDFKALEKLEKALDNYFKMDVLSNLNMFIDLIPSKYKNKVYLPTKNLLDYILVRLQGLVKLMERVVETSKIAAFLLEKRMHIGHFWKLSFILFSLVSRVYTLARYTTSFVCDFYRKLLPFSSQLKNTSTAWLPNEYVLPNDLREWLSVDWLEFDDEVQIVEVPSKIPDIIKFFDLVDDEDDDVQFCEEYLMIDDEDESTSKFPKRKTKKKGDSFIEKLGELRGFDNKEDIGEVIKIEDSFQDEGLLILNDESEEIPGELHNIEDFNKQPSSRNVIKQLFQSTPIPSSNNITIINISMDDITREAEKTPTLIPFTIQENETEAVSISDSSSNISISETKEESICTLSDENDDVIQITDIPTTKSDENDDVIQVTDIPTTKSDNTATNKETVEQNRGEEQTQVHTIIDISDGSLLENKNDTPSICSEDSVIILDAPVKPPISLKQRKKELKLQRLIKKAKNKVNKNSIVNFKTKIKKIIKLNSNDDKNKLVSVTKMGKKKTNSNTNTKKQKKLIKSIESNKKKKEKGNKTKEGNDHSIDTEERKTKKVNKTSKTRKQKLKMNSKKLKLALQSLHENGNVKEHKNKYQTNTPMLKQRDSITNGENGKVTLPQSSLSGKKKKRQRVADNIPNSFKVETETSQNILKPNNKTVLSNSGLNGTTKQVSKNGKKPTKTVKRKRDKTPVNETSLPAKKVKHRTELDTHTKQLKKLTKKKKLKADSRIIENGTNPKTKLQKTKITKTKTDIIKIKTGMGHISGESTVSVASNTMHPKNINGKKKLGMLKTAKKKKKVKRDNLDNMNEDRSEDSKVKIKITNKGNINGIPKSGKSLNYTNQSQPGLQLSHKKSRIFSKNTKKKNRYWENYGEMQQSSTFVGSNVSISINNTHENGITESYIPLAVFSAHNKSSTVKLNSRKEKRRKHNVSGTAHKNVFHKSLKKGKY